MGPTQVGEVFRTAKGTYGSQHVPGNLTEARTLMCSLKEDAAVT